MCDISEVDVRDGVATSRPLWDELFPAEQPQIVELLMEHVDVSPTGADSDWGPRD